MKNFKDYLIEGKKTYDFKIKIAGDLPDKFESNLKTILEKYSVNGDIKKSTTPIQKVPLDFVGVEDREVHIFEVSLNYPVISPVLEQYIIEKIGIDNKHITIRTTHEPEEEYQRFVTPTDAKKYKAKLETDYVEETSDMDKMAQDLVGEKRVLNLFKELGKDRKENKVEGVQSNLDVKIEDKLEADNTKSTLGNKKMPDPKGIRK